MPYHNRTAVELTSLEKHIEQVFGLEPDELGKVITCFETLDLEKGAFFLRAGHHASRLAFVQEGYMREYADTVHGEVTKWISMPGYFVTDIQSFMFGTNSRWNIQALTKCKLAVLSRENYQRISREVPRWNEIEKKFLAGCFAVLEGRVMMHLSMNAEERYHQFYTLYKELFSQVPLQYLASMLGMTPETLSRIRRK